MVRSLVAVLALAAAAAHAQENPEIARDTGATAPLGEGQVVLSSRSSTPGRDAGIGANSPSLWPSTADGGVDGRAVVKESTLDLAALAACPILEILLSGAAPAVRHYAAPAAPASDQREDWGQAPFVRSVVRCGQRFFLQVSSKSAHSWIVDHARVEGPQGETLQVTEPKYRQQGTWWAVNVIVAEAPPGVKLSGLKLYMVGKDGRVAQTAVEDLP